jgi:hypothetical protein
MSGKADSLQAALLAHDSATATDDKHRACTRRRLVFRDLDNVVSVLDHTGKYFSKKADSLKAAPLVKYRATATDAIKDYRWGKWLF